MHMKIWNFGIIGAGMVADFHAKSIQHLPNARLTGICGAGSGRAASLAQQYNCREFSDYQSMLCSPDIDIVTIATPSGLHMEPAIEAARRGKHVLCEKPLDITLERIDAMMDAHAKAGTRLGGIFNYRFIDTVHLLKDAIDKDRFGILTFASVRVPWWRSNEYYQHKWRGTLQLDGGGAMMNQAIHMVDMLQYLMGPVKSLHAYTATLGHQIEAEDTATAILRFSNNALGSIYGSTASFPGQLRSITITGTKGTATLEDNSITVWQFSEETPEDEHIRSQFAGSSGGGGASDPSAIPFELHERNIAAFLSAVESGKPFELEGREARKAVEIILGMYTSARENKAFNF
ncbi:MAG: Gfo/Idh/MocA family oxidoreductase [Chitinophagaceae bacterium]|nr:Gfo/Idh/MocA family oxidoreductase [Chitinophagaceae bacterium]